MKEQVKEKIKLVIRNRMFWKLVAIGLAGLGVYVSPEIVDAVSVVADVAAQ